MELVLYFGKPQEVHPEPDPHPVPPVPFEGKMVVTAKYHGTESAPIYAGDLKQLQTVTINGEGLNIPLETVLTYDFAKANDITVVYTFKPEATSLDNAFKNVTTLTDVDFTAFENTKVTAKHMFDGVALSDGFIHNLKLTDYTEVFAGFAGVSEISCAEDQVITAEATDMSHMFDGSKLETVADLNMKSVTKADGLFDNCANLMLVEISYAPDSDVFAGEVVISGLKENGEMSIVRHTPEDDARMQGLVTALKAIGWTVDFIDL